ncbi:MAG: energy transducer TonB [Janthinobacterium lividum]
MLPPLIIIFLLVTTLPAYAQRGAPVPSAAAKRKTAPEKIYTFVEQMPDLPSGGGQPAMVAFLLKALQVPKLKDQPTWPRTNVSFIVGPEGKVYDAQVVMQAPILAYRQAMLNAVRTLPRFKPGYQAGRPVAVKLTLAFSCIMIQ